MKGLKGSLMKLLGTLDHFATASNLSVSDSLTVELVIRSAGNLMHIHCSAIFAAWVLHNYIWYLRSRRYPSAQMSIHHFSVADINTVSSYLYVHSPSEKTIYTEANSTLIRCETKNYSHFHVCNDTVSQF